MGLLDDAIREHLELKRRRGADPGDIERAEREALGPVRRMPEPGQAPDEGPYDAGDAEMLDEELDYAYGEETGHAGPELQAMPPSHRVDGPDSDTEFFDHARHDPAGDQTVEYRLAPEEDEHGDFDQRGLHPDEPRREPPPESGSQPGAMPLRPPHEEAPGQPEDPRGEGPKHPPAHEADEDVLEETPDFLQDTPDHDRLWFEQRPPRDFKFDD